MREDDFWHVRVKHIPSGREFDVVDKQRLGTLLVLEKGQYVVTWPASYTYETFVRDLWDTSFTFPTLVASDVNIFYAAELPDRIAAVCQGSEDKVLKQLYAWPKDTSASAAKNQDK